MEQRPLKTNDLFQSEAVQSLFRKLELYASILSIAGLIIIGFSSIPGVRTLLNLGLSTLTLVYFIMARSKIESESKLISISFYRIYGIGLSLSCLTILFTVMKWPFPHVEMIIISMLLILISLFFSIGLKSSKIVLKGIHFIRLISAFGLLIYAYCFYFLNF